MYFMLRYEFMLRLGEDMRAGHSSFTHVWCVKIWFCMLEAVGNNYYVIQLMLMGEWLPLQYQPLIYTWLPRTFTGLVSCWSPKLTLETWV